MDEYTPTTEEVRNAYSGYWHARLVVGKNARAEFDRWLAEHDRVVAANAWDEAKADNNGQRCVCAGEEHRKKFPTWHGRNPYRITEENN